MGERSVRIRKAVGSNPIISISFAGYAGILFASVAQWIEHRIPVPGARVRLLPDACQAFWRRKVPKGLFICQSMPVMVNL